MSRTSSNKDLRKTMEQMSDELSQNSFVPKDMLYSTLLSFISKTLIDISHSLAIIADVMKGIEDEDEEEEEEKEDDK